MPTSALLSSDFFTIWTPSPGVFEVGLLNAVILCCLILCALGEGEHRIQVWPVAEYYMKGPESPASGMIPSLVSAYLVIILLGVWTCVVPEVFTLPTIYGRDKWNVFWCF